MWLKVTLFIMSYLTFGHTIYKSCLLKFNKNASAYGGKCYLFFTLNRYNISQLLFYELHFQKVKFIV